MPSTWALDFWLSDLSQLVALGCWLIDMVVALFIIAALQSLHSLCSWSVFWIALQIISIVRGLFGQSVYFWWVLQSLSIRKRIKLYCYLLMPTLDHMERCFWSYNRSCCLCDILRVFGNQSPHQNHCSCNSRTSTCWNRHDCCHPIYDQSRSGQLERENGVLLWWAQLGWPKPSVKRHANNDLWQVVFLYSVWYGATSEFPRWREGRTRSSIWCSLEGCARENLGTIRLTS